MNIQVDYRENKERVSNVLNQYFDVNYEFKPLQYGDYILDNKVIFERKTLTDFIESIKDGRIFRQTYHTTEFSTPYILILEGTKSSITKSEMSRQSIQGALVYVSVYLGIPILRYKDAEETLSLIVMTGRQGEKYKATDYRRAYLKHKKAKKSNNKLLKTQILQNLPGIGNQKAIDVLQQFGSIKQFVNSTEQELQSIKGIGKKTAEAIHRILN